MPAGMVITIAAGMALAMPRIRLRPSVPDASRRARFLAWRLRVRQRDTMNALAAQDVEAADLLALARSPGHPPVTASRAEMIAAAPGRARQQLTPALTGVG